MQARATEGDRRVGGWKRWVARDRPATGGIEENGQRKGGRELARMPEGRKVGGKGGPRDARKGWQGGGEEENVFGSLGSDGKKTGRASGKERDHRAT